MKLAGSCSTCSSCYVDPRSNHYRCMRGIRDSIPDLFLLGRLTCKQYKEFKVDMTNYKSMIEGDK